MLKTEMYGRVKINLPENTSCAEVLAPDGEVQILAVYTHQDADFTYDHHGYETVTLRGSSYKQAAYTATQEGRHILRAYNGDILLEETLIECSGAAHGGFVEVSRRDPRYFSLTDGSSYVPIGPNLVGSSYMRLPAGSISGGHRKPPPPD